MLVYEAMPSAAVTLWHAICQPSYTPGSAAELIVQGYGLQSGDSAHASISPRSEIVILEMRDERILLKAQRFLR